MANSTVYVKIDSLETPHICDTCRFCDGGKCYNNSHNMDLAMEQQTLPLDSNDKVVLSYSGWVYVKPTDSCKHWMKERRIMRLYDAV